MRAAVYHGPRDIRLEEVPVPSPGEGEVLIEVLRSGLCGTDVTEWVAGPKLIPLHSRHPNSGHMGPMIPGHEMVGRVVESKSPEVEPGTLVAGAASVPCWECDRCREGRTNICQRLYSLGLNAPGSHAEYVAGPAPSFVPLPEGLSIDAAGIAQPLAVGVHAARRAGARPGDRVVLFGAGSIGTFVLSGLRHLADGLYITVVDVDGSRLERAARLGADATVDGREDLRDLEGADLAIEAAGVPELLTRATELVRPGGRVLAVGMPARRAEIDVHHVVFNEITIDTTVALVIEEDLPAALDLLCETKLAEELVDSVRPLSAIPDTLDEMAAGQVAGKVLIDPRL
jgi:(R,R)-butanediol dehydrogenase/meso-butanediol dehydrogenase/diacetyl reductase